ncbi:hypothetical protein T492DRAFT_633177 [Pavlovales sp. CCMP2436]|nr:hypothetical protein T492DRAFT_633177 [Pavlovales sp. CCMP2436]
MRRARPGRRPGRRSRCAHEEAGAAAEAGAREGESRRGARVRLAIGFARAHRARSLARAGRRQNAESVAWLSVGRQRSRRQTSRAARSARVRGGGLLLAASGRGDLDSPVGCACRRRATARSNISGPALAAWLARRCSAKRGRAAAIRACGGSACPGRGSRFPAVFG